MVSHSEKLLLHLAEKLSLSDYLSWSSLGRTASDKQCGNVVIGHGSVDFGVNSMKMAFNNNNRERGQRVS